MKYVSRDVHATRQDARIFNPSPLGFLYDTEEEFFAILLANIYASETGRPIDLRSDHHGFEHLTTDTNAKFLPKQDMSGLPLSACVQTGSRRAEDGPRTEKHTLPHSTPIRPYYELQRTHVHFH